MPVHVQLLVVIIRCLRCNALSLIVISRKLELILFSHNPGPSDKDGRIEAQILISSTSIQGSGGPGTSLPAVSINFKLKMLDRYLVGWFPHSPRVVKILLEVSKWLA